MLGALRREFRNVYRGPDKAYASMDFSGVGHISEEGFLGSLVVRQRLDFSPEELRDFFLLADMFKGGGGMSFDSFKKTFFPHLYLI